MKNSRDLLLLVSCITACAAGAVAIWGHRQLESLTDARDVSTRQHTARETTLQQSTALAAQLKSQLLAAQRDNDENTGYDQWSRQQAATRSTVESLRQRLAILAPPAQGPVAPLPALVATADRLRELGGRLALQWAEFEQRGSGLTANSREYLASALLPLLLDDLGPALDDAAAAEEANAEHLAASFPHFIEPARLVRSGASAATLAALGFGAYAFATRRRGPRKLLAAAWQKSATDAAVTELSANLAHNHTAPDRTAARILLAVSDEAERTTLSTLLTNAGYGVVACDRHESAQAALAQLVFSLVVLDAQLPGGESEPLLEAARKQNPTLPALLITSAEATADSPSVGHRAVTQTVRRPINPRTLLWSVSEILFPEDARSPNLRAPAAVASPPPAVAATDEAPVTSAPIEPTSSEPLRRPLRRTARPETSESPAPETPPTPPPPTAGSEPEVPPTSVSLPPPSAPVSPPVDEDSPAPSEAPAPGADSNSPIPRKRLVRRRSLPSDGD